VTAIKHILPGYAMLLALSCSMAQSPSLVDAPSSAVAPGKSTRVTFSGKNLAGATGVWTSFPAKAVIDTNSNDAGKTVVNFTLAKEVPVGIGALRLATTNGISDLRLIMIDNLPVVAKSGTNKTIASAQELKLPVAVDGHCEELGFDYYTFKAAKGQRVSIELVANRLGSPLDPVVRVLDAADKELAYCDDDPATGSDARVSFRSPAAGRYVIELRDIGYQG